MPSNDASLEKTENPWLRSFLSRLSDETVLGQLLIRRNGSGFELHHKDDPASSNLKPLRLSEVRPLANFTAAKKFRPLKSTPDLATGWILTLQSSEELESALQAFYPNALADLHALQNSPPPITSYRDFTARQTGMYRITTFLKNEDVERVIQNVCHRICLKTRLWPIEGSQTVLTRFESIPCLEPCAIFLESARKEVRALQEKFATSGQADSATDAS